MSDLVNIIRKNVIKVVKKIIESELSKPLGSETISVLKRILQRIEKSFPY